MDILPPEIVHNIFYQLDLQQRIICLLVCRSWWDLLDKQSLFYSVNLEYGNVDRFINMMEQSPRHAAQVKEFSFKARTNTSFDFRKLFPLFPNVRVLNAIRANEKFKLSRDTLATINPLTSTRPLNEYHDLTHLQPKVEILSDFHNCDLVSQMLYSNLGGRLETLCLDFKRLLETPPILYQLKDLPVLKRLVLKSVKFKLDALEEMHRNIPSIQDLSLDEMAVLKGNRPLDIIPATCMTRLKFSTVSIYDYRNNTLEGTISKETHGQFYQYIVKKYINITDIDYKDDALNSYQQDEIKHIYLNGLLDFFKLTVPIRNELTLSGLPDDVDPFEPLDSVDARINHLALVECSHESSIQYLYHSKQPDYIQDLHLLDTVLDSIHLLKDMPALTSLNVEYANSNTEPICVHGFLAACPPTLKSLAIAAKYLKTEPFNTKLDSIKSLSIGYGPLTSCLGDIISFCFPNLADLYVQGAVTENVNIKLMYPQFLTATFITGNPQLFGTNRNIAFSAHVLSFKSSNQAETQYYICDGRSNHNKPTKIQYADIVDLPILSVETCANIKVEVAVVNKVVLC